MSEQTHTFGDIEAKLPPGAEEFLKCNILGYHSPHFCIEHADGLALFHYNLDTYMRWPHQARLCFARVMCNLAWENYVYRDGYYCEIETWYEIIQAAEAEREKGPDECES